MEQNHPRPENYLVFAILTTILCCLPTGIVSIVYANKVNTLYADGKFSEADAASKNAKTWAIVSAVIAVLGVIVYFLFFAAIVWAWRERTILSYVALVSGVLVVSARMTHWLIPSVNSIALGYPEPTIEQNPLVWFLYIQALNVGSLIFVICVGYRFISKQTHNKSNQSDAKKSRASV